MTDSDPASADPRAYRTADADGKPLAVFVAEGSAWLMVGGELARLDAVTAMKLGGRLNGAGQRAIHGGRTARAQAERPAEGRPGSRSAVSQLLF